MVEIGSSRILGNLIKQVRKNSDVGLVDTSMLTNVSAPVLCKLERGLSKGDINTHTSLFRLLPQLGVKVYLGQSEGNSEAVASKESFAKIIRRTRKHQHLSQSDVASLLDVSIPTLSKLESIKTKNDVRFSIVLKVLSGLGIKLFLKVPE